jgi:outer membrane protein assembly factor BamA
MRQFILTIFFVCTATAQDDQSVADRALTQTRAGQIELEREQKATKLKPEGPEKGEKAFDKIQNNQIFERLTGEIEGWRIKMGGLIPYSGFSLGPEYYRHFLHRQILVQSTLVGSYKEFYKLDTSVRLPSLADDHAFVSLDGMTFSYPRVDYYGPGPESSKHGRSDYSLEETGFSGTAGVKPFRYLRIGATGGYLLTHVGPGQENDLASTDTIFTEQTTPGIESPSYFAQGGGFLEFDWRDNPGDPAHGGNYTAHFTEYDDVRRGAYSFQRVDLEVDQFFGFLNDQHVIALRGRVDATEAWSGQRVPFYLQPTLGGPDDLRGFRAFRFYDNNAALLNGEYRWNLIGSLAMALFVDAGQVYDRWQQIDLRKLHKDYGFGFRVKARNGVFMRIDTAFSGEGVDVWARFNNIF